MEISWLRRIFLMEVGGRCIKLTSEGGFIIMGNTSAGEIFLIKTDENGNI